MEGGGAGGLEAAWQDLEQALLGPDTELGARARAAGLLAGTAFLVIALVLNCYIIGNICYKGRIRVCYFSTYLLVCLLHPLYCLATCLALLWAASPAPPSPLGAPPPPSPLARHLPAPDFFLPAIPHLAAASRATAGAIFLLVGALTVERFLSSSVRVAGVRVCTGLLTCAAALAGPAAVLAFRALAPPEDNELWFGVEVAVYVISPLLLLTVFGTVNYCKVSHTSRLLPGHQVQAVKLNIGVTIVANLAIFLFLVQACLELWLGQLAGRGPGEVEEVLGLVQAGRAGAEAGVGLLLVLLPLLYLCLASSCSAACCCPAISRLQELEVRYSPVAKEEGRL